MGVLNITPDSFSDGGRYASVDEAVASAERMAAEGAAIIDVGGESTRPGATPVPLEEEMRRVLPVIEQLARRVDTLISVDTSQPELMRRAVDCGAGMINDVRALRAPGALEVMAANQLGVCLMHMRGEPPTMQRAPEYRDVVAEVRDFLAERVQLCRQRGIAVERLCVDPGFGFGKRLSHNLQLLRRLDALGALGLPVLVGLSRKSLSAALGRALPAARAPGPDERLAASLALAALAVQKGARIVRAHDVAATLAALRVVAAVCAEQTEDEGEGS
jgi:dihydropteroate synthase